ncbi:16S rRNA (adenine(1518)-N(6)/adenine(1519)-N(6))-dimethyltransferase RsmA [Salsuginibacillus kocurii]|uniref:16S rRNA (adenine(1518)-N(6)/adenine(1519)-N(6))- dimethyltransferase RsmA n=1 Tax=Salsuginibacillus kocurii TaxID=427078 RepID=UPI000362744C|nr:16S rRNA (adenine(1518)-N(6)/adenine(1519)-N(6))-dimethyltransferase RsmA [Salsuginibacillus kocurii]
MTKDIATPARTKEILEANGFTFKKSLGQNFLIDVNTLKNIVKAAKLTAEDGVIEIGPGIGALTEQLAKQVKKVSAVEIDQRLIPVLNETMAPYRNVSIHHGDILEIDVGEVIADQFQEVEQVAVVGNLPYYVTTPILMGLLESRLPVDRIVAMMQKEVAERLEAVPGSKAYGSLSIAAQYYADVEQVMTIPRTVFVPKPNVDSAIIRMELRKKPPVEVEDESWFFYVVQSAFTQRRKTLWNNMVQAIATKERRGDLQKAFARAEIDSTRRGETLTMEEFARLSEAMKRFFFTQEDHG